MSTSRNAPCWCGSGKKFKRCHYPKEQPGTTNTPLFGKKIAIKQKTPSFGEFMEMMGMGTVPHELQNARLQKILADKKSGVLAKPSLHLIDKSQILTTEKRSAMLDIAAKYVDENQFGRNEMCQQFAMIVKHLLKEEGIDSRIFEGTAKYTNGDLKHEWAHFWLLTENNELIDGNIDSLPLNPFPPEGLEPLNYWGPSSEIPKDRVFTPKREFTDKDEFALEKQDNETAIWKKKSMEEYKKIFN